MTSSKKGSEVQLISHPKSQFSSSAASPKGLESATVKEALALTLQREALEAMLEDTEDAKLDEPPINEVTMCWGELSSVGTLKEHTFFSTAVAALEATLENESADDE